MLHRLVWVLGLCVTLPAAVASASPPSGHPAPAPEKPDARFERLKALAGEWEGTASHGDGKGTVTVASIKVVSAGSAVMLVTDPSTPHEMVTMFHRDDADLIATHYCAAQNQPRMKAAAGSDAKKLTFEFVDGTNLAAHPARMQRLVVAFPDAETHVQEWTYREPDGKTETMRFELKRKK